MRILLIGAGGREHALALGLLRSPQTRKLYVAPGNGGTQTIAENVALDSSDHETVVAFCRAESIDFVVVGPDAPVVAGLGDAVRDAGIACFCPSKAAGQLEGSKNFTKALCAEMNIPTAAYGHFTSESDALAYVRKKGAPIVIKADGLALGKGVTVAQTLAEAEAAVRDCFAGAFGAAGAEVVIEECLTGEEVSLFVLCDGHTTLVLDSAQDHKRAFEGDTGPNTGGMGAYSPAPVMTPDLLERTMTEIVLPTVKGMAARGTPYQGVLYAGLMLTADGPKLIEYNARFGDPETQALILRLQSDLVTLLHATATGTLAAHTVQFAPETAITVVLASKGYPGTFEKGTEIHGADGLDSDKVHVFHAGTARDGERLLAMGGRVLNVTALGRDVAEAQARAYAAVDRIDWPNGFCRRDIGWRALPTK